MRVRGLLVVPSLGLAACAAALGTFKFHLGPHKPHSISGIQHNVTLHTFTNRDAANRCGPGLGKCSDGNCCSTAGYCGKTKQYCLSPDCQIDFGHCDADVNPRGPSTEHIPRPHVGNVPYGPALVHSCSQKGTVALTFDDGPNKYTGDLLNLLDKYNAKATFFITGINNAKGPIDDPDVPWISMIQRMKQSGHQVASHTWSHQDLSHITPTQRRDQILRNEAALRNVLGGFPTYMRPPYSSCLPESGCLDDLGTLGYHIILYDLDTKDYSHDSPSAIQKSKDIFDSTLAPWEASDKSWLVIAHDVHEQTVHNLTEHMLKRISEKGYEAVTVGQCFEDPEEFWYRKDDRAPDKDSLRKSPSRPSGPQSISLDGTCGGNTTCIGSRFGPCCSRSNFCGISNLHCGFGCILDAGSCFRSNNSLQNKSSEIPSRFPDTDPESDPDNQDRPSGSETEPKRSEAGSLLQIGFSAAGLLFVVSVVLLLG